MDNIFFSVYSDYYEYIVFIQRMFMSESWSCELFRQCPWIWMMSWCSKCLFNSTFCYSFGRHKRSWAMNWETVKLSLFWKNVPSVHRNRLMIVLESSSEESSTHGYINTLTAGTDYFGSKEKKRKGKMIIIQQPDNWSSRERYTHKIECLSQDNSI